MRSERPAQRVVRRVGNLVEQSISHVIEGSSYEAPPMEYAPEPQTWYRVPLPEGKCGDGSEYHIYIKIGNCNHLMVFLSGGGVAYDEYSAARPVTGGTVAAWEPNYYWNNLRPLTQMMNINIGITELAPDKNPFFDWNMVVITYATGDFHVGNNAYTYLSQEGKRETLHFHGHANFTESMKMAKRYFPHADKLLIAGDSAGAFAVPAVAGDIADQYYPDCQDITLFSDSALLIYDKWQEVARDVWKADKEVYQPLVSGNIAVDWYTALLQKYPHRFRCLYASSRRDYLLSAFYNNLTNGSYSTNLHVRRIYQKQSKQMVEQLSALDSGFGFFINNWKNAILTVGSGGTIHTAVRQPYFYRKHPEDVTMAKWLADAVDGKVYNVGLRYLS